MSAATASAGSASPGVTGTYMAMFCEPCGLLQEIDAVTIPVPDLEKGLSF
ncbi:MAG: hypothetical protein WCF24_05495 [Acidimicrobiales bacterium]